MGDEIIDYYFHFARQLTKTAGKLILDKVYEKKKIEIKASAIDFVTETDQEVEKLLIKELSREFPDHKFIGEETVSSGGKCNLTNTPTWIIDPIDGTMNFVHSFPHSCISLALFIDCEPKVAIIYNPLLEQLFTAVKNKGAFLNEKRIHVSDVERLADAIIMMEVGSNVTAEKLQVLYTNQQTLIPKVHGTRSLGSCALNMAMVALGCADGYFEFGIHIWDIAAGELIVTEAGGVVADPCGDAIDRLSRRVLCASTAALAKELSRNLEQYYPVPRD